MAKKLHLHKKVRDAIYAIKDDEVANLILMIAGVIPNNDTVNISLSASDHANCWLFHKGDCKHLTILRDRKMKNDKTDWTNVNRFAMTYAQAAQEALSRRTLDSQMVSSAELTTFHNKMCAQRANNDYEFEIVTGEKIRHYYHASRHANADGAQGSLYQSCMKKAECQPFFDIYCENTNTISLLILKDKNGLVAGRALLWKFRDTHDGKMYKIMDRIYTDHDYNLYLFFGYAVMNSYWRKKYQKADDKTRFIKADGTTKEKYFYLSLNKLDGFDYYPYLDTFTYADYEGGIISNDCDVSGNELGDKFEKTGGTTERKLREYRSSKLMHRNQMRQSSYRDIWIDENLAEEDDVDNDWHYADELTTDEYHKIKVRKDKMVRSKFVGADIYKNYAKHSRLLDDYIPTNVACHIDNDYVTRDMAETSAFNGNFFLKENAVRSTYHDGFIDKRKSAQVDDDWVDKSKACTCEYSRKGILITDSVKERGHIVHKQYKLIVRKQGLPITSGTAYERKKKMMTSPSSGTEMAA